MDKFKNERDMEKWLDTLTVKDVVGEIKKVITVSTETTVEETLKILGENNILSAPVKDPKSGEYVGLIDMFDLVTFIVNQYFDKNWITLNWEGHKATASWETLCSDLPKLKAKGKEFMKESIKNCINISSLNPLCSVTLSSHLPELLFIFKLGLHRAVVVDSNDEIINIVSQSNVVNLLAKNVHKYGNMQIFKVKDIGLGQQGIISIKESTEAIYAFYLMKEKGVSAIGIVNKDEKLIGNISVSDLRGFQKVEDLLLPVSTFLRKQLALKAEEELPLISCDPETAFETVVVRFANTRVHRLYNVDKATGKGIGVISLTDIMKLLDLRVYVVKNTEKKK